MPRYLRASFLIGLCVTASVLALHYGGVFTPWNEALRVLLGLGPEAFAAPDWLQGTVIAVLAFAVAWTTADIVRVSLKSIVACVTLLQALTASFVAALYGLFFSPCAGALAILLSFLCGLLYARTEGGRRKRVLAALLGKRVSDRVFAALLDRETLPNLQGTSCRATFLVFEVLNPAELAESLGPEAYVSEMNLLLQVAAERIVEGDGYLEGCDGEGVRAVFCEPFVQGSHSSIACQVALDLQVRLRNLTVEIAERSHRTVEFGIGVETDEVVLAVYGGTRLGAVGVAGELPERARTLALANQKYGTHVLLGAEAFTEIRTDWSARAIDMLPSAGGEVYEPIADALTATDPQREVCRIFWQGVVLFREKQNSKAADCFRAVLELLPSDGPSQWYLSQLEEGSFPRLAGGAA